MAVGDAAVRNRLYDAVEEDGTRTRKIEGYFGMVESGGAPALERFLADPLSLSAEDRASLAFLLAHQIMRTPAAAETIDKLAQAAFQTAASGWFSDQPSYAEAHRRFYKDDATDDEIEQAGQETLASIRAGNVIIADRGGAAFAMGIGHAAEQSFLLFDYDWTLLHCPRAFITSDRAYAIHDPTPPWPWAAQGILSSVAVEVCIPLSEDYCLLLRPREGAGTAPATSRSSFSRSTRPTQRSSISASMAGWTGTSTAAVKQPLSRYERPSSDARMPSANRGSSRRST